ncbi:Lrp/AsnC family transcriptional regulator [Jatrophihabitans sp. YIM 134969]
MSLDQVDCAVLGEVLRRPRAAVREYARTLDLARGTVQARIDRLLRRGVIRDFGPTVDLPALGFPVLAFVHLDLKQGRLEEVVTALCAFAQVVEAHSTTGDADLLCRVVARDHADLETVIQSVLGIPGVVRTRSEIALSERVSRHDLDLLDVVARDAKPSTRSGSSLGATAAAPRFHDQ